MYLLTAVQSQQPDYVALGMFLAIVIVALVMAIRKRLRSGKPELVSETVASAAPAEPAVPAATAPGSAGKLKLHDVEPKTAAMLMAIVADKAGQAPE